MGLLLQIADTTANTANMAQKAAESFNLFDLLQKGGLLMYPLYILFIATIFVFLNALSQ